MMTDDDTATWVEAKMNVYTAARAAARECGATYDEAIKFAESQIYDLPIPDVCPEHSIFVDRYKSFAKGA